MARRNRITGLEISKVAGKVAEKLHLPMDKIMNRIIATGWYKIYRTRRSLSALEASITELAKAPTLSIPPKKKEVTKSFYAPSELKILNMQENTKNRKFGYSADNNKRLGMFKRVKSIIQHGTREQKEAMIEDYIKIEVDYDFEAYEKRLEEELIKLEQMTDQDIANTVLDIEYGQKYNLRVGDIYGSP